MATVCPRRFVHFHNVGILWKFTFGTYCTCLESVDTNVRYQKLMITFYRVKIGLIQVLPSFLIFQNSAWRDSIFVLVWQIAQHIFLELVNKRLFWIPGRKYRCNVVVSNICHSDSLTISYANEGGIFCNFWRCNKKCYYKNAFYALILWREK